MTSVLRFLASLLDLAVLAFSACVIGAWLSDTHWLFDAVAQPLLPALAGLAGASLAIVGITLALPRGGAHGAFAAFGLVMAVLGVLQVRGVDNAEPAAENAEALRIYQHNIWVGNWRGEDVVETIREVDPDIVALVEAPREGSGPALDALQAAWPYVTQDEIDPAPDARLRLFSKFPMQDARTYRHRNGMAVSEARIDAPSGQLSVILVHLTRPWPFRGVTDQVNQLGDVLEIVDAADCPCLLLGDFNSAPWGRLAKQIDRETPLRYVPLGWRGTWPSGLPPKPEQGEQIALPRWLAIPIDLAFVSPELGASSIEVLGGVNSDHRAVTFDIAPAAR